MAITGSRCESIVGHQTGSRLESIWRLDNGSGSLNSNENVGLGNSSSSVYGVALAADGDQTDARKPAIATNSKAVAT